MRENKVEETGAEEEITDCFACLYTRRGHTLY